MSLLISTSMLMRLAEARQPRRSAPPGRPRPHPGGTGRSSVLRAIVLGLALAAIQPTLVIASTGDLQGAKVATARFHSVNQALEAGYGPLPEGVPLHECIAAFDGSGAMGFHYLNGALLDTTIDPAQPEVLVYAPDEHGRLRLAALEYVVFQVPWTDEHGAAIPVLFGEAFHVVGEGNRYEVPAFFALHVWLWQPNPAGTFADFNPNVSCD